MSARFTPPDNEAMVGPFAQCVRNPNATPLTYHGTNSWILAAPNDGACVVVDPGPDDAACIGRIAEACARRGLTVAAVAMVACLAIVGLRGLNFGIEFVGGTSVAFHGTGDITTEQMREAFNDAGEPDAVIPPTETGGEPGFLVRTTTTSAEDATAHANQVAEALGMTSSDFEVTTIGPDWGASVIQSSLIAFLVSILLIIIYIAIRFEYKMGVMAIVALFHDLILVVGIYALVGREVNPNTIAALLTILGYSLYDTVVVFHRINDNMKGEDIRCTFMTMANHSMNQVFIRTINTVSYTHLTLPTIRLV